MSTKLQQKSQISEEELLRVLTKGMITIPKLWRDSLGLKEGEHIKAKKKGDQIILERLEEKAPYRIYTQEEINQFLKHDVLPPKLRQKVNSVRKPHISNGVNNKLQK